MTTLRPPISSEPVRPAGGMKAAPRAPVPCDADLAKHELAFERVHQDHESPVRLRHKGQAVGVFPTRSAAAHLISRLTGAVVVLLLWLALPAEGRADPGLLAAIAAVEDWQGRRGAAGEIGPYQMMPRTWASYRGTADERAVAHLAWLRRELLRRQVDPSPFNLALCWNAGLQAVVSGRAPVVTYDYARRVVAMQERTRSTGSGRRAAR